MFEHCIWLSYLNIKTENWLLLLVWDSVFLHTRYIYLQPNSTHYHNWIINSSYTQQTVYKVYIYVRCKVIFTWPSDLDRIYYENLNWNMFGIYQNYVRKTYAVIKQSWILLLELGCS